MTPPQPVVVTQIDAFTDTPFTGNPAGVLLLDQPADDTWMQAVAAEMAIAETAFLVPIEGGWNLRWFTPAVEVPLCGHATLASAHHLFHDHGVTDELVRFDTLSGWLTARRLSDGWIELDLPADPTTPVPPPPGLLEALGVTDPLAVHQTRSFLLVEVGDPAVVRALTPDITALAEVETSGVIVTAAGDAAFDIVSRFFAPRVGIDEDPVTGSAHCALGPYWAARLGHDELLAHQASPRGGVLRVRVDGDRVRVAGQAVHALRRA